tara:strand:+ start:194 stop:1279 length:1086 start_codon:yes stop_codon:yes gene_type:complete
MVKKILVFGNIFHHLIENNLYTNKKFKDEILKKKSYLENNVLEKCDNFYIQYTLCKYILRILKEKKNYDVYVNKLKWGKHFKIQYLLDFFSNIKQNNICDDLDTKHNTYKRCIKSMKGGSLSLKKNSTTDFFPNNLSISELFEDFNNQKINFDISKLKKRFSNFNSYIFVDFGSTNSKVFIKNDIRHINIHNSELEHIINDLILNPNKTTVNLKKFINNNNHKIKDMIIFATAGIRNSTKEKYNLVKKNFNTLANNLKKIGITLHSFVISGHLEGYLEMRVFEHKFDYIKKKYNTIDLYSMGGGSIQHVTNKNNNYYFEVDNRFGGNSIKEFCIKSLKKRSKKNKTKKKKRNNSISYSESL